MILGEHFAKDLSIRSKVGFRNLEVASVGFGSWAFGRFWGLWGLRGFGGHPSQIEGVCQEGVAAVGGAGTCKLQVLRRVLSPAVPFELSLVAEVWDLGGTGSKPGCQWKGFGRASVWCHVGRQAKKKERLKICCRASPSPSPTPTTGISNRGQTCLASARALVWQAEHSHSHSAWKELSHFTNTV